eukprot:10754677-Lingulodinium_polyedra.AAC.1
MPPAGGAPPPTKDLARGAGCSRCGGRGARAKTAAFVGHQRPARRRGIGPPPYAGQLGAVCAPAPPD